MSIDLRLLTEDSSTNEFMYAMDKFGSRPCRTTINKEILEEDLMSILNLSNIELLKNVITDTTILDDGVFVSHNKFLYELDSGVIVSVASTENSEDDGALVSSVSFLYLPNQIELINDILDLIDPELSEEEDYDNNESGDIKKIKTTNMLLLSDGEIILDSFPILEDFTNFSSYYNESSLDEIYAVRDILETGTSGIITVNGVVGVGKTTMLKYLTENTSREVIFVPIQILGVLDSNDIHKFFNAHRGSVVVLDDYDLDDYDSNKIINSIVHFVDGFKANIYNLTFIISSNNVFNFSNIVSNNMLGAISIDELKLSKANSLRKMLKIKSNSDDLKLVSVLKGIKSENKKDMGY